MGVSRGGVDDRENEGDASLPSTMLAGLPTDFRTVWKKTASRVASEHERIIADVYDDSETRFAEDLFWGDAGVGVYLIEHMDGGTRFAVGDERGRTVADSALDAGPSVEACVRCHAGARDAIFPVN
jgi:hypothetical protein